MIPNRHRNLILASASPRRRLLLSGVDLKPAIRPVDMDETPRSGEDPRDYVLRMAESKAKLCAERMDLADGVALTGDTTVTIDGKILSKPESQEDAVAMLSIMSGRRHSVITGWASIDSEGELHSGLTEAQIEFRELSNQEIDAYVATGECMDKAGAYGIQGGGGQLVSNYQGDFDTIVGFPVADVLRDLRLRGVVSMSDLGIRWATIQGRVAAAAHESGRSAESVKVIGASKAQSQATLDDAYASGMRHFGESYVQELVSRDGRLSDDVTWHFIGRLQRNKAARVLQRVSRIHTIDSERLADTVSRLAVQQGVHVRCLVQVNIGGEESKAGVTAEACADLVNHLRGLPNVTVDGLMTLPPRSGFAGSRRWFRRLRDLRDSLQTTDHPLPQLSMGMSGDFDGAVAEGATFIRVGTALFGARA